MASSNWTLRELAARSQTITIPKRTAPRYGVAAVREPRATMNTYKYKEVFDIQDVSNVLIS
jgi:hypothetical protein